MLFTESCNTTSDLATNSDSQVPQKYRIVCFFLVFFPSDLRLYQSLRFIIIILTNDLC